MQREQSSQQSLPPQVREPGFQGSKKLTQVLSSREANNSMMTTVKGSHMIITFPPPLSCACAIIKQRLHTCLSFKKGLEWTFPWRADISAKCVNTAMNYCLTPRIGRTKQRKGKKMDRIMSPSVQNTKPVLFLIWQWFFRMHMIHHNSKKVDAKTTVERRFESYSGSLFSAMKTEYVVVAEQAPPLGPAYSIIPLFLSCRL